jgi:succinate-semialdehyde dehydrogenase / glutarate-semialdehyde dehydrogenase
LIFKSLNPYTDQLISEIPCLNSDELEFILKNMHDQWELGWSSISVRDRIHKLQGISEFMQNRVHQYASLITRETGKPIDQSVAEVEKCIQLCEWFLTHSEEILKEYEPKHARRKSILKFQSTGIVLGIMPWNFPFWQVFRYAIPNLLGGNAVALKPAPETGLCGAAISNIIKEVTGEEYIFQTLHIDLENVAKVIADSRITGVTFTGSNIGGSKVAAIAGQHLKKCVLELGGSDPAIVCQSADIKKAAREILFSRINNNGQTCIAAKRWLIHQEIYTTFIKEVKLQSSLLKIGDPMQAGTQLSCLYRAKGMLKIKEQLAKATETGAEIHTLSEQLILHKLSILPTIVIGLNSSLSIYHEEFFAPVALIEKFDTSFDAIQKANATQYGLGASIWTNDDDEFWTLSDRLQIGNVAYNQMLSSDPSLPFGGVKDSGFGRELGEAGLKTFLNLKAIHL